LRTGLVTAISLIIILLAVSAGYVSFAQNQNYPALIVELTTMAEHDVYPRDSPDGLLVNVTARVVDAYTQKPFNSTTYPFSLRFHFSPRVGGLETNDLDAYVSPAIVDVDSNAMARTLFYPPTQASLDQYLLLRPGETHVLIDVFARLERADDGELLAVDQVSIAVLQRGNTSSNSTSGWPCIIATATYGSPLASQVVFMRSVRDDMIGQSATGKLLVNGWNTFYYSWSPPIAQAISGSQTMKSIFTVALSPLLGSMYLVALDYSGLAWISPDLAALHAFILAAMMSIGVYLILPGCILWFGIKRARLSLKRG